MDSAHDGPTPSRHRRTPGRRRFLGLAGAGAVGLAGLGELAFAADGTPVRTYDSQQRINHRKWAVALVLRTSDPAAVAAWITGGDLRAETDAQVNALADAAASGLGVPRGNVVVSWVRAASVQRQIWDHKYDFLRTSTAPGVSRHHLGSDVDFFDTTPQNWADGGPLSAHYAWLRANASRHGFLQTYTAESAQASPAISQERWHWSYAPVSEAVLDYIRADESVIEGALDQLWGYDPARYTYIKAHWRDYMYHVNERAYFGS